MNKDAMYLINAFSANMMAEFPSSVSFTEISAKQARIFLLCAAEERGEADMIRSAVGHADTAAVFESILNIPVPVNRVNVSLKPGDSAILGQYIGPRLPEGATTLPEGATIRWLLCAVGAP
jgi:hypothetical protein